MWINDKWVLSEVGYNACKDGDDNEITRGMITDSWWAYQYCKNIKDIPEMEEKIIDPEIAITYYLSVKGDLNSFGVRFGIREPKNKEGENK